MKWGEFLLKSARENKEIRLQTNINITFGGDQRSYQNQII
jgi:hypothetical protein